MIGTYIPVSSAQGPADYLTTAYHRAVSTLAVTVVVALLIDLPSLLLPRLLLHLCRSSQLLAT